MSTAPVTIPGVSTDQARACPRVRRKASCAWSEPMALILLSTPMKNATSKQIYVEDRITILPVAGARGLHEPEQTKQ